MTDKNNKLFEIQKEIKSVVKDKENPYFHSSYADINTFIELIKPLLNKYELTILQPLSHINGRPAVKTIVKDSDGTVLVDNAITLPDLDDPQKMGSAITYYRRYSLQSLFFMLAEDDDANKASSEKKSASDEAEDLLLD